jgi:hypothetical protein
MDQDAERASNERRREIKGGEREGRKERKKDTKKARNKNWTFIV